MDHKISLIISFYNRIDYLKLLFASLERQSFRDFEVIIADDGSRQDVVNEVLQLLSVSSFKTQHIWHEDKGWRKTVILNKAILASNTEYLVFIDGDCFLHKKFLEEHYLNKKVKTVLVGRRVNLSGKISKILNPAKIEKGYLEGYSIFINLLWHKLSSSGSHVENAIFIKSKFLRKFLNKKRRGILGSNFSAHKSDLISINGFDERYLAPAWGEDTDIDYRFGLIGIKNQSLKHIAIQYHTYHKTLDRVSCNAEIYQKTIDEKMWYTPFGIDQIKLQNTGNK